MVTPFQNKTQDQVMAEFDALFGNLVSTAPTNPTPYRMATKRDVFIILLPENLKISKVFEDLKKTLGERYLLILSSFYVRGLLNKKKLKKFDGLLSAHNTELRFLGGERYRKLIDYGLAEKHIVRGPTPYIVGKQSFSYMINGDVLSLKTQKRYQLATKNANQVRSKYVRKKRDDFAKKTLVHQKIAQSIDGLTFDYATAIKHVFGLPDGEKKEHRKSVIEQLMFDGLIWSTDEQGRNYTVLVTVPRDIRRYFSYQKEPLWVVDIGSSQPLLHALLYPTNSDEKKRYQSIVEDGEFWDFMNEAAEEPFDLMHPEQKSELKEAVFREVYYARPEDKKGVKTTFGLIFKREFPILWEEINASKRQTKKKPAGPLARVMQKTEAEAVSEAILVLKDKPYPLISIHDAIVTTKNGVADVEQALKQSFLPISLVPRLAVKQLTI